VITSGASRLNDTFFILSREDREVATIRIQTERAPIKGGSKIELENIKSFLHTYKKVNTNLNISVSSARRSPTGKPVFSSALNFSSVYARISGGIAHPHSPNLTLNPYIEDDVRCVDCGESRRNNNHNYHTFPKEPSASATDFTK